MYLNILFSQLIFEETIGTGQFSSVRKAHSIDGTKEYAVKIISKSDPSNYDREYIIRELRILSLINHPNIPKIYGFFWRWGQSTNFLWRISKVVIYLIL